MTCHCQGVCCLCLGTIGTVAPVSAFPVCRGPVALSAAPRYECIFLICVIRCFVTFFIRILTPTHVHQNRGLVHGASHAPKLFPQKLLQHSLSQDVSWNRNTSSSSVSRGLPLPSSTHQILIPFQCSLCTCQHTIFPELISSRKTLKFSHLKLVVNQLRLC